MGLNSAYNAFKALDFAAGGRALARGSRAVAKGVAGTGVKGFIAPVAIGASVGAASGAGYSYGTNNGRGMAGSAIRGALYGAAGGALYRGGRNFYSSPAGNAGKAVAARMAGQARVMGSNLRNAASSAYSSNIGGLDAMMQRATNYGDGLYASAAARVRARF